MAKQHKTAGEGVLIALGYKPGLAYAIARSIDRAAVGQGGSDDFASRLWLELAARELKGYQQGIDEQQMTLWRHDAANDDLDVTPPPIQ